MAEQPDSRASSDPGPRFYTASETARMLRIDESTLYRHLRTGAFPAVKIGGRYVVPAAVIEQLVSDVLAGAQSAHANARTAQASAPSTFDPVIGGDS